MNYKYSLLLLFAFIILFNFKEEENTVFLDVNISIDNNNIVEVNIPEASGNKTTANKINTAIQKKIISILHIGNKNQITSSTIEESINNFNKEFNTFKNDFQESAQTWEAQIDGEVMYQSPEIISIALTSYINTGGAHGTLHIYFLNFNTETGQKIDSKNLFKNIKRLKKIAKPYYADATKDKNLNLGNDKFELPANIGYSEEGIVLLYNTYEIAPYTTGIIEFIIPYKYVEPYLVFNSL